MTVASRPVLVVDDDADVRNALGIALEIEGYQTDQARDGLDALAHLRGAPPPALIVLDIMMPRMNGAELMKALREDPALAKIPVVVLSGDTRARQTAEALGACDCLAKPVDLDELLALVARYAGPAT